MPDHKALVFLDFQQGSRGISVKNLKIVVCEQAAFVYEEPNSVIFQSLKMEQRPAVTVKISDTQAK